VKERLLTLGLAACALLAFYAMFVPRSMQIEPITRPTSLEGGPNGYLGLARWLQAEGVGIVSFRDRYTKLPEWKELPQRTGNLLLSTAPYVYPMRDSESEPLQSWIADGNTLLLVAGLSDTPDWSMEGGGDPGLMSTLQAMTDLQFTEVVDPSGQEVHAPPPAAAPPVEGAPPVQGAPEQEPESPREGLEKARAAVDAFQRFLEPQPFEMKPTGAHPLLQNVDSVQTISEYPTSKFRAISESLFLELAHERGSNVPALWLLPYGDGQIIVCAYGNVFTNKTIAGGDNARLLANIVAASVNGAGMVIFDDAHQGLVAFYDPDAFFGDSRLHRSLWWLLGLWLVFVLGAQRLRPAPSRWAPLDLTTFVRATGGFMARVLKPASAGQRLIRNFLDDVRRRTGLTGDDAAMWEWLRSRGSVVDSDVAQARHMQERAGRGQRIDLPRLQNLLVQLRAAIK
jgi:Domain of unknown function (DUF4350)